jgi:hypothetical protein
MQYQRRPEVMQVDGLFIWGRLLGAQTGRWPADTDGPELLLASGLLRGRGIHVGQTPVSYCSSHFQRTCCLRWWSRG